MDLNIDFSKMPDFQEDLKKMYMDQVNAARNEFSQRLLLLGLSPTKVKMVESCKLEGDELIFKISAVWRHNEQIIDLDEYSKLREKHGDDIEAAEYELWLNTLPGNVKAVFEKYPTNKSYKHPAINYPVQIYSYSTNEDGEVLFTIAVHDPIRGSYNVDKIKPSILMPYHVSKRN